MADAFIPISDFGKIEPCITPSEAAEKIAKAVGAPRFWIKRGNDKVLLHYNGRIPWQEEAWTDVRRLAAVAVLDVLLTGSLRSYVEAGDSGKHFRIPVGYWSMKSGAENPWSILETFDRCDWAHGFDESMVGQPILVAEADAPTVAFKNAAPINDDEPQTRRLSRFAVEAWVREMINNGHSSRDVEKKRSVAFPGYTPPAKRIVAEIYQKMHLADFGERAVIGKVHPLLKARRTA